jgi:putative nucleotidyltransferase with HDIG domain
MRIPSFNQAQDYLARAAQSSPGLWVKHSQVVARAAKKIAKAKGLDEECAEIMGLLHDIGRYKGVTHMMHSYDGYQLLKKDGYTDAAQICVTHSFPVQEIRYYTGANDCTEESYQELVQALEQAVYTDYDRLIQLCDAIALPDGVCLLEKRLMDVALRHGVNDVTVSKWKAYFRLKAYFEDGLGGTLYDLFPEAVEVTFATALRPARGIEMTP